MRRFIQFAVLALSLGFSVVTQASEAESKAHFAVSDILFEYDGAETFASYVVSEDGFVDITFARNIPDELYSEILERLRNHEDIDGVLAGTTGPACSVF